MTTKMMHSLEVQLRDCRELLNQTNQELAALGDERNRLADENEALRAERDEFAARAERLLYGLKGCDSVMCDGSRIISYSQQAIAQHEARILIDETPAQSLAHIRAAGAREALERAMADAGFSGTVVRVDVMREIIEQMEGEV